MGKKNIIKIKKGILIIGIIGLLIVGVIIGANWFAKTKYINVPIDSGKYCYEKDMEYYVANSVTNLPSDWTFYVVGKDVNHIGSQLCLNVNYGKSDCVIIDICPNCVTHKITCVCKK